jgi:acetoin utilization deacetylase AcuC-like enzyme
VRLFYTDEFELPLPEGSRFPLGKYRQLRERLIEVGLAGPQNLFVPAAATVEQLILAHTPDYARRVRDGELTKLEQKRIGFPWSPQMAERARRSTGATIEAAYAALEDGVAANLAGGTHHAFADAGEGYCVFNDVAVAIRVLQAAGRIERAVVIDCDVHQGNGTASIFADDPRVTTFSIHGAKNFPLRKVPSTLDVEVADGAGDEEYVAALDDGLARLFADLRADIAFYLAGADPYAGDRFGRLKLTKAGLAERDRRAFAYVRAKRLPLVITMAGGYAERLEDIAEIQAMTIAIADETLYRRTFSS